MEYFEKNVLKRKRHGIAMEMNLKKDYVSKFKENSDSVDHIMKIIRMRFNDKVRRRARKRTETLQYQKMIKFLELLPQYGGKKAYCTLVSILEKDYFWLGEELKAELKAEKHELVIEDYIHELAMYVIGRKFGKSLRLSVNDKKALVSLIEIRVQYAKEVCRGHFRHQTTVLENLREVGALLDAELLRLIAQIEEYIKLNKASLAQEYMEKDEVQLTDRTNKMDTHRTIDEERIDDHLEFAVEKLIEMMNLSLVKKDSLAKERHNSVLVMKCDDQTKGLDTELDRLLKQLDDELAEKLRRAQEEDDKIAEIKAKIRGIYSDIESTREKREKEMIQLTNYLSRANDMLRLIQDDIEQLQRELMFCKQKTDQYKVRFAKLERTRRIGYVNDEAPERANKGQVIKDKARAKEAIIKPRIIQVKTAQNVSSNNNNNFSNNNNRDDDNDDDI